MTFLRFFVASAALPGASGLRLNRVPFEALVGNSGTETLGHDVCPGGTADGGAPGLRVAQMGDQAQKQCEIPAWNSGYTDSFYMEQMKIKGAEDEQQETSVSDHQKFVFNGNESDESAPGIRTEPDFADVIEFVQRSEKIEAEFRRKNYKLMQHEKLIKLGDKLGDKLVEENAKLAAELHAALDENLAAQLLLRSENESELAAEKKRLGGRLSENDIMELEAKLWRAEVLPRSRSARLAEALTRENKLLADFRAKQAELKAEVFAEQDKLWEKLKIKLRAARRAGEGAAEWGARFRAS